MANLKNIMIDSLRDGTETETMWRLRKSFLHKNLFVNDTSEFKEHLIKLSYCFVSEAMGEPHDYPSDMVQEMIKRSSGMEGNVNRAWSELQNPRYQSKQRTAKTAAAHYYDKPKPAKVPFAYGNQDQSSIVETQSQTQYGSAAAKNFQSTKSPSSEDQQAQGQMGQASYNQHYNNYSNAAGTSTSNYNHEQGQQNSSSSYNAQNKLGAFSTYVQNQTSSSMNEYNQGQQSYNSSYPSSYDQNQQQGMNWSSYHEQGSSSMNNQYQYKPGAYQHGGSEQGSSYPSNGQDQNSSFSYDGSQKGSNSTYGQNNSQQVSNSKLSFTQNQKNSSSHGQSQQNSKSWYNYKPNVQDLVSYDQSNQHSAAPTAKPEPPFSQNQKNSSSHQSQQNSKSWYNYNSNVQDSSSFNQTKQQSAAPAAAYGGQGQHKGLVSSPGSGSFVGQKGLLPSPPLSVSRTQYVEQAPSLSAYGPGKDGRPVFKPKSLGKNAANDEEGLGGVFPKPTPVRFRHNFLDANALSVIPVKKAKANRGVPSRKALRKEERRLARQDMEKKLSTGEMKGPNLKPTNPPEAQPNGVGKSKKKKDGGGDFGNEPLKNTKVKVGLPELVSWFEVQPLFNNLDKIPIDPSPTAVAARERDSDGPQQKDSSAKGGKDKGKEDPHSVYMSQGWVKQKVPLNADAASKTTHDKKEKGKDKHKSESRAPQDDRQDNEEEDDSPELLQKLVPIFDMAIAYSKLTKDASDPFMALQKCAASANQKVKCVSKSSFNAEGGKELTCSVFANDICLVSVVVKSGTNPSDAKKMLAESVLEKISSPHLRLGADPDNEGGLKLEASNIAFEGTNSNPEKPKDAESEPRPKNKSAPDPARKNWRVEFDSYFAWRNEKHPELKKVRTMGHLFATIPFKRTAFKRERHAEILQLLANVLNIRFQIVENQPRSVSGGYKYSMIMDEEVHLFSWDVNPPLDVAQFISKSVLEKVSMPFLCLDNGILYGSMVPFSSRKDLKLSAKAEVDVCQKDVMHALKSRYKKPVCIEEYCLYDSFRKGCYINFEATGEMNGKEFQMKMFQERGYKERMAYFMLDGEVVGGITATGTITKKMAHNSGSESCMRHLRKCHWTIRLIRMAKGVSQHVFPDDLLPELKGQENALQDSNKGFQLLSRMGWEGGGIGRKEDGIAVPIQASQQLSKNSGLGYKKLPDQSNFNKLTDISDVDPARLLEAYHSSRFHKELFIVCSKPHIRGKIHSLAEDLDMKASTRGLNRNRRVVVSKKVNSRMIFSDLLDMGGRSDQYELVPPQEENYEPPMDKFDSVESNKKNKRMAALVSKREKKKAAVQASTVMLSLTESVGTLKEEEEKEAKLLAKKEEEQFYYGSNFRCEATQCTLLAAPPLVLFKPGNNLCDIEYNFEDSDENEFGDDDGDDNVDDEGKEREVDFPVIDLPPKERNFKRKYSANNADHWEEGEAKRKK